MLRRAVLIFFVAGLAVARADDTDAVKKDLAKFEGTWIIDAVVVDGQKQGKAMYKDSELICKGEAFTFKEGDVIHKGTMKLDASKKPKEIDVVFTEGPGKDMKMLGIYELTDDTYKVCFSFDGKDRPKEFEAKEKSGFVFEILKKKK